MIQGWTEVDDRAVATARILAADAVQQVGNGHPGTAMALAPAAYLLFQRHLRHDPSDPQWLGRDRFILSCGHSSLTLYIQLYLSGYGLELEDLKSFRVAGSKTPGHPEFGHTAGVETTTGPLGQGVANGVGMAMAARYERGLFDPDAAVGESPFDHHIYVLCSDGDLEEGVSGEASSLAGTQALGNLIVIWDDNRISIEGDTHLAFTEDVVARYRAYGWHCQEVDTLADGQIDISSLDQALTAAKSETGRPSFIRMKSVIAWPAPKARNTAKSHGSALGADEVAATKLELGFDPARSFDVAPDVLAHTRSIAERASKDKATWSNAFAAWQESQATRAGLLERLRSRKLPSGWSATLPSFTTEKEIATRAASGKVIQAIAAALPEFWGGSADLAESNNTTIEGGGSFLPPSSTMSGANPYGRVIHFGVREHAMGAILNGIALHGLTRPIGGTFLVFSDYMRGAVRLAALMGLPVTFVWTHDSIGLGEDGPTHQPIEHIASLRAIPGLDVVRPADANEVTVCWRAIVERGRPVGLLLSRQNLPVFDRSRYESAELAERGAYVLSDSRTPAEVLLLATGSEVAIALAAQEQLEERGVAARVVSMPSWEWFAEQDAAYRENVLPRSIKARVSIEAGVAMGWREFVGDAGEIVSIEHFGASAQYTHLYEIFGLTAAAVVQAAEKSLARVAS
jgi:transketolase